MRKFPFRQIAWGGTIKLGLARAWASGFVLTFLLFLISILSNEGSTMSFTVLLLSWVFPPIFLLIIGGVFGFLSLFPMAGWLARLIAILIFCWGDPILYVLRRTLGIFDYVDLKPFNFVAFLYLLKEDDEN